MKGLIPTLFVGIGTYLSRTSFILILGNRTIPERAERALRNVGPAVLAGLVASLLVGDRGLEGLAPSPELGGLVAASLVAWRTKNMMWTLVAGMATVWTLAALWT